MFVLMVATETASNNEDRGEYGDDPAYVSSLDTSHEEWVQSGHGGVLVVGGGSTHIM